MSCYKNYLCHPIKTIYVILSKLYMSLYKNFLSPYKKLFESL